MGQWDEDDYSARWTHGLFAIPVLLFLLFDGYLLSIGPGRYTDLRLRSAEIAAFAGAIYLEYRLLWYAITGRRCINRDYFD